MDIIIILSIYGKKCQREKFLVESNKENKFVANELADLTFKSNEFQDPLEIQENTLKSTFIEIELEFVELVDEEEKKIMKNSNVWGTENLEKK